MSTNQQMEELRLRWNFYILPDQNCNYKMSLNKNGDMNISCLVWHPQAVFVSFGILNVPSPSLHKHVDFFIIPTVTILSKSVAPIENETSSLGHPDVSTPHKSEHGTWVLRAQVIVYPRILFTFIWNYLVNFNSTHIWNILKQSFIQLEYFRK